MFATSGHASIGVFLKHTIPITAISPVRNNTAK